MGSETTDYLHNINMLPIHFTSFYANLHYSENKMNLYEQKFNIFFFSLSTTSHPETITSFSYLTSTVVMTTCPNPMVTSSSMPGSAASTDLTATELVPSGSLPGSAANSGLITCISVPSSSMPESTVSIYVTCILKRNFSN